MSDIEKKLIVMWHFIGQAIWFILPAGLANMAASLSRFLPVSNYPVDGGRYWRGQRIFGANKTWRGLISGALVGQLVYTAQLYLFRFDFFHNLSLFDYQTHLFYFGALLGLGALLGDLVKSFFKRGVNIPAGRSWLPFDQIDYTIGALALGSLVYFPGWPIAVFLLIFGFGLHILFNLLGFVLRLQKNEL